MTINDFRGQITDQFRAAYARIQPKIAALDIDFEKLVPPRVREYATEFGFHHRPVLIVGAATLVGFLYVAATDPFATPAPGSEEAVAARIAPIGTVRLAPAEGAAVADSDQEKPVGSVGVN